jgi:hypothetical protein
MKTTYKISGIAIAFLLGACAGLAGNTASVALTGNQEVPPVASAASGSGTFTVGLDRSVAGNITTTGLAAIAAHIHIGKPGANGPVVVGLAKTEDNIWSVPAGAKLTEAQYAAYLAGELYVNVHTAANKGGEIRAQLVPADLVKYGQ